MRRQSGAATALWISLLGSFDPKRCRATLATALQILMSEEHIKVTEDSGIVTITLNRPERLNSFIGHMRRDLAEALEEAGSDPSVRVVIITGAGRAFCAGGDVNFMAELVERNDSEEFARLLGASRRVILAIRHMNKPVIAQINGPASGAG
ncbi:MAG TPA: enoyl-CoA hydratase/isomerase family protein, partial [Pyrinomonadaceae bacterium]